ncbi:retropepsin-like aspartic protease family protein [Salaquimonas pukyongi]|uniref:retropepsin-like aspartic protease family protein n=1 Tax=Salaquimonas pukyongi TaxID=2712698 RepID=UPI00096BBF5A|nr:TIGR02281 family clan AA aspartic protease [Salaquimonas pukyongi]
MKTLWIILGLIGAGLILLILNHDQGTVFGLESNLFAGILFYGVWGTVIGAAVLSRGSLAQNARNATLWLGIILALMTGYIYRYELQDFGSALTAGLIPGSPVSGQSQDGRGQVMVVRSANGHFEIDAAVNGTPVRFLVDTGASTIVLTADDAEQAGIDVAALSFSTPIQTANGATTAAPVTIAALDIGDISRNRTRALVAGRGSLDTSLLGMNFLQTLWSFEIRGDRLILTD